VNGSSSTQPCRRRGVAESFFACFSTIADCWPKHIAARMIREYDFGDRARGAGRCVPPIRGHPARIRGPGSGGFVSQENRSSTAEFVFAVDILLGAIESDAATSAHNARMLRRPIWLRAQPAIESDAATSPHNARMLRRPIWLRAQPAIGTEPLESPRIQPGRETRGGHRSPIHALIQ